MYPEHLGQLAAVTTFIGFNLTFFPQFILGYLGMPRRYHAYPPEFQVWNVLSTAGATILAAGYLMPFGYLIWSLFRGEPAGNNPWGRHRPRMADHLAAAQAQLRRNARRHRGTLRLPAAWLRSRKRTRAVNPPSTTPDA